jgi:hypothetical protein
MATVNKRPGRAGQRRARSNTAATRRSEVRRRTAATTLNIIAVGRAAWHRDESERAECAATRPLRAGTRRGRAGSARRGTGLLRAATRDGGESSRAQRNRAAGTDLFLCTTKLAYREHGAGRSSAAGKGSRGGVEDTTLAKGAGARQARQQRWLRPRAGNRALDA